MRRRAFDTAVKAIERITLDKVLDIPYKVSDKAPETYQDMVDYHKTNGHLLIWSGGSDTVIYSSRHVNYAFRALHDSRHILLKRGFTLYDEGKLAAYQATEFFMWAQEYGYNDRIRADIYSIIMCEIYQQRLYAEQTNKFIEDQTAFTHKTLNVN